MNKLKKTVLAALILSGLFTSGVYAETSMEPQVFIDGYTINHTLIHDGRAYVQLRELSHYIGYELEYDDYDSTISCYKSNEEKPVIRRESSLYPTNIEELEFGERREIIKVYELTAGDSPREISKEPFEKDGYSYKLTDITKSNSDSIDRAEHSETVTVETNTNDTNSIIQHFGETIEYASRDGYIGILKLDIASIKTEAAGHSSSSYTISETREYPNLSSPDTSLVPKTISVNGKTLKLAGVNWKSENNTAIDYTPLADAYTAVASYTGTGTKTSVTGYVTTAEYKGEINKTIQGNTIYTAYFSGTKAEQEPEAEPTVEELEQQLKDAKAKAKEVAKANGEGLSLNPLFIIISLLILGIVGGLAWLMFFRGNVAVYNLIDTKMQKIGKARITPKDLTIDLSHLKSKAMSSSFTLLLGMSTAKKLDGETVAIVYKGESLQHTIVMAEDGDGSKKDYQINAVF